MSYEQGDEGGILVAFLYSRLRANSAGWPVIPMPADPSAAFPCIGFNFLPVPSTLDQGGNVQFATFLVNVVCIGQLAVDNLEPLRPVAKEIAAALKVNNSQPGLTFGTGRINSCTQNMAIAMPDRSDKGQLRWMLGAQWRVAVQPDLDAQ